MRFSRLLTAALAFATGLLAATPSTQAQTRTRLQPKFIYFPPHPPPLEIPANEPQEAPALSLAPDALRPFVCEPFYAPLSTFISPALVGFQGGDSLDERDRENLRRFRLQRDALLQELRDTLTALLHKTPAQRASQLASLARRQAPALTSLEAAAETLRQTCARKADWSELRQWRLHPDYDSSPQAARQIDLLVLRAAAYYAEGLLPAQRRLLREIAAEIEAALLDPRDAAALERTHLRFQPETARIPWPRGLPPDLEAQIASFDDLKSSLKRELTRAIFRSDGDLLQGRALRRLAEQQADPLAELEQRAEEIRTALSSQHGYTRATPPQPWPPALLTRIERFRDTDQELARRTGDTLETAASAGSPLPPRSQELARSEWFIQWAARLQRANRPPSENDIALLQSHVAELDALRDQLQLILGSALDAPAGPKPDAFLDRLERGYDRALAMHEYDIASLEPSLSPAQRRLLFSGAIERLRLPLPRADRQPTRLPDR